jgi:hypothetical protein
MRLSNPSRFSASLFLAVLLFAASARAQEQFASTLSLPDASKAAAGDSAGSNPKVTPSSPTSNNRLLFLPNFLTLENSPDLTPLTAQQKFAVVARSSFDYAVFPLYALRTAISTAQGREPSYGPGAPGYTRRYALTFADCTVNNFMTGAVLPSLLHQDPRFYRLGEGPTTHRRFAYALSRILFTRTDSGRKQFNFSEIFGSALATGISTYSYHPPEDRTLRIAATGWGTQLAFRTFTLTMKEFWPDLRRKLSHTPSYQAPAH